MTQCHVAMVSSLHISPQHFTNLTVTGPSRGFLITKSSGFFSLSPSPQWHDPLFLKTLPSPHVVTNPFLDAPPSSPVAWPPSSPLSHG
jgi:hypothetical protein